MRFPASEKLEIIRIVEQSHLPVRRTLDKLGILSGSFYAGTIAIKLDFAGLFAERKAAPRPSLRWRRLSIAKPTIAINQLWQINLGNRQIVSFQVPQGNQRYLDDPA